jgi:hypothetical protein
MAEGRAGSWRYTLSFTLWYRFPKDRASLEHIRQAKLKTPALAWGRLLLCILLTLAPTLHQPRGPFRL